MCIRSNPKLTKINDLHLLRYTPDQYHIFQQLCIQFLRKNSSVKLLLFLTRAILHTTHWTVVLALHPCTLSLFPLRFLSIWQLPVFAQMLQLTHLISLMILPCLQIDIQHMNIICCFFVLWLHANIYHLLFLYFICDMTI